MDLEETKKIIRNKITADAAVEVLKNLKLPLPSKLKNKKT